MRARTIWQRLRGTDPRAVTLLQEQAGHARDAVAILHRAVAGDLDVDTTRREVAEAEHEGDRARTALAHELATAIAPPLDREDLFRLSRSIDDVLDNLRDFASELALLQVDRPQVLAPLLVAVDEALERLTAALEALGTGDPALNDTILAAKRAGNRVRRVYDEALADLLVGEVDVQMLRQRELLRRLDVVGLRFGESADALADGALKRYR